MGMHRPSTLFQIKIKRTSIRWIAAREDMSIGARRSLSYIAPGSEADVSRGCRRDGKRVGLRLMSSRFCRSRSLQLHQSPDGGVVSLPRGNPPTW